MADPLSEFCCIMLLLVTPLGADRNGMYDMINERLQKAWEQASAIENKNRIKFDAAWHITSTYYHDPAYANYIRKILKAGSCEHSLWAYNVKKRDGFQCRRCGGVLIKLASHHMRNRAQYPEVAFDLNNGITFCASCHWEFHKRYGKFKNSKEQVEEFLGGSLFF